MKLWRQFGKLHFLLKMSTVALEVANLAVQSGELPAVAAELTSPHYYLRFVLILILILLICSLQTFPAPYIRPPSVVLLPALILKYSTVAPQYDNQVVSSTLCSQLNA